MDTEFKVAEDDMKDNEVRSWAGNLKSRQFSAIYPLSKSYLFIVHEVMYPQL